METTWKLINKALYSTKKMEPSIKSLTRNDSNTPITSKYEIKLI